MTAQEKQTEALARATQNVSWANYPAIFEGFTKKGIPESEIIPRENVFTFHAWRALGRTVCKGEKGVKVVTWISRERTETDKETGEKRTKKLRFPKTTTVFHVSQTTPLS